MTGSLEEVKASLPASWYVDPGHYRKELDAIWYRSWVCVGRLEELPRSGDFISTRIGDQGIIVLNAGGDELRAWHNVCRHRGSVLCQASKGHFRAGRIICPYHTWTYALDGRLIATPGRIETPDFKMDDFSLFAVHVDTWQGFVFVNLDDQPEQGLLEFLGEEAQLLDNWPLDSMRSVCREVFSVNCNWKVFWENYSECYHCPRLHPELCRIMPNYRKAVVNESDLPDWQPGFVGDSGTGRISANASTWTLDGHSALPVIESLTDEEKARGATFANVEGSMFVIGHPDYARSVRILPTGPESIDLIVDWLLPPDVSDLSAETVEQITGLSRLVIEQDGRACELNQEGLRNRRFDHGVLVPQEYALWEFHEWLRTRLDAANQTCDRAVHDSK